MSPDHATAIVTTRDSLKHAKIAAYVLGAFEARGSISIARGGAGSITGRISIDMTTLSPVLEALFGPPTQLRGYAKATYRYITGTRAEVVAIGAYLRLGRPQAERLQEIEILMSCVEAETEAQRVIAMDAMRSLRALRGTASHE